MRKIHYYDNKRLKGFNELITSKCGWVETVPIGRFNHMTTNPLHVTCKRCFSIMKPEIIAYLEAYPEDNFDGRLNV